MADRLLFTTSVPVANAGALAGPVREDLSGRSFESATELAVLDGKSLLGLAPIERLLAAAPGTPVEKLAIAGAETLAPDADPAAAAHAVDVSGGRSIAVVDAAGDFVGVLAAAEIVALLHAEHAEDLARIGGYVAGSNRSRNAAEEPVGKRLAHRLPWLLIGLLGAMLSAVIVGAFEEELAANVLIAFFVPAVVYMADAVGTQTETVLIRGLAAGVTPSSVVRRELVTGLATGAIIGAAFFVFAVVGWGDTDVAVAVAIALLASCSIATGVAMALPTAFQRFGIDPAFGSGPLATVIQDLLSIIVYFAAVVLLL